MVEFILGFVMGWIPLVITFAIWNGWSDKFDGNAFEFPILEADMELRFLRYRLRDKRRALKKAAVQDNEYSYNSAMDEYQKAKSAVEARRLELRSPVCEERPLERYEFP